RRSSHRRAEHARQEARWRKIQNLCFSDRVPPIGRNSRIWDRVSPVAVASDDAESELIPELLDQVRQASDGTTRLEARKEVIGESQHTRFRLRAGGSRSMRNRVLSMLLMLHVWSGNLVGSHAGADKSTAKAKRSRNAVIDRGRFRRRAF